MKRVRFFTAAAVLLISFLFVFNMASAFETCWEPWSAGEMPISNIGVVICGDYPLNPHCFVLFSNNTGTFDVPCETIPIDLNWRAGGSYLYFAYFRDAVFDPVTDLTFVKGANAPCPSGYEKINEDLNHDAGGEYIYTCLTRNEKYPPLTDLWVTAGDTGSAINTCPEGFTVIPQELNEDAGGAYIYACIMKEHERLGQMSVLNFGVYGLDISRLWLPCSDPICRLPYATLISGSGGPVDYISPPTIPVPGYPPDLYLTTAKDGFGFSWDPYAGSILLSTGLAADRGLGSTDRGNDGKPDFVRLTMLLERRAPNVGTEINFTTQFITGERDDLAGFRKDDYAAYSCTYEDGTDCGKGYLGRASTSLYKINPAVTTRIPVEDGHGKIYLSFWVQDDGDGLGDSGLRISNLHWGPRYLHAYTYAKYHSTALGSVSTYASVVEPDTSNISLSYPEGWWIPELDDIGWGFRSGSILLSTGRVRDLGLGNTDLKNDSQPDSSGLELKFKAPGWARYLYFTTQFITSEASQSGSNDYASLEITRDLFNDRGEKYSDSDTIDLGQVRWSSGPIGTPVRRVSRPVTHNEPYEQLYLTLRFKVVDAGDGNGDSGLLISDMHFSKEWIPDWLPPMTRQTLSHGLGNKPDGFGYPYLQIREDWLHGTDTNRSALANPDSGSILLSTGLATDGGTGNTELKAGQTDSTTYGMRLAVPDGAQSLRFTADFLTSEDSSSAPGDSFIILVDGKCLAYDAQGQCVPVFNSRANPSGTSVPVILDLLNKKEIMVDFYITDESDNNQGDSAVVIKDFHFSPDPSPGWALKILTGQIASELDQGNGYVADAWLDGTDPLVSASVGSEEGSIALSTGLASDLGAGDTILGSTGETDYTVFGLDLNVPSGAHTLSFTTNFITSEGKDGEGDVFAIYIDGEPMGVVNSNNIGGPDDVTLRNRQANWSFYVKCKQKVSVLFYIADEQADRGGDSAVVISNLRFSTDPVPEVTAQSLVSALTDVSGQVSDSWLSGPDPNWSALSIPSKGQIVFSTGRAIDFGLGSSDLCGTSTTDEDYTKFGLKLSVPSGMKALGYKTLLLTRSTGNDDLFTVKKNGSIELEVLSTNSLQTNQKVERWMNVEGLSEVTVEFQIADGVDGKNDFTVILSDVRFSGQDPVPPGYDPNDGVPPDEQTPVPPENTAGDPVDIAMGSYLYNKELIRVPSVGIPFSFSIHYNSGSEWYGPVGNRWGHSYDWFIEKPGEGVVVVRRGDAGADYFVKEAGTWVPKFGGVFTSLTEKASGGFTYSTKLQMSWEFDASGNLTSISDAHGNTLSLIYAAGKLSKIVDTRGNATTLTYDDKGRLLSVFYDAGPLNQSVSFSHNEAGDLTGFTKVDGTTTTFTYDPEARLLTGTRADGVTFITNVYDEKGRVIEQWDAKGASRLYGYGDGTVTLTDRRGNKQTKTFDILGRLIQWDVELEETTATQNFTYDPNSNRTSVADPLGRITEASYDVSGNMTEHTDALGNVMSMTPGDPLSLPTTTDRGGNTFKFEYDPSTRTRTVTDPLGGKQIYIYNSKGQILSITDQMGNMFTYAYTDKGDQASITDPLGGVTRYEYDGLGRKISTTKTNGHKTTFTYDATGRLLTRTNAAGQTTLYTYDINGRMLTRKESSGAITRFSYTLTNKIASVTDPTGNVFTYEYDAEDKMVKRIDPMGRVTIFTYDKANRLISVTDAKSGKIEATYNEAGERLKLTDPNGNVTTYEYDSLSRIVSETDPVGNTVKNTYEARGLVSSITNGRGQTIGHEYDGARRLTGIVLPDATTIKHTYDVNGNRVRTVGRDNSVIERQFDALNRLISRTDPFGNKIAYEYDKVGNLITLIYSDGKKVHYEYDSLNRLIRVTDWEGRITEYTYNPAGKLETAKLPDGSVVSYTFNPANQLTGIIDYSRKGKLNFSIELTLDKAGNPIRENSKLPLHPEKHIRYEKLIFQVNQANQLIDPVNNTFSYDADGNMTLGLLERKPTELVYDELNQLIQAGADTYRYDADGLRIEATINGRTVGYVQDPNAALSRVLEEQDEKGRIIARYIYGVGLIGREEVRGHNKFSDYGRLSIYHFDGRGNTIALTDEHGHITDRYAYDPYGRLLGHHDVDHDHHHVYHYYYRHYHHGRPHGHHETNPFTFCGQFGVMDDGNGLYFMRTRYYAPALMRFVQRDVLYRGTLHSTQSANRYGYVEGNPVLRSDPNGDFFFAAIAVGIVIGLATQVASSAIMQDWGEWYDWVGAVAGGAIGGAIGGGTMGLVAKWGISSTITLALAGGISGALGGMATNAIQQGFGAIGGESWDWTSFGISAALGGVLGAAGGSGLKGMADDLMNNGNFWAMRGFFQNTTRMLKDTLAEETFAGLLEMGAFAGYLVYDLFYSGNYGANAPDSLPPDPPLNPGTPFTQDPSGGLKNDTN